MPPETRESIVAEVQRLGPWFHNIRLPFGVETTPDSAFGDFPASKWRLISPHLPADMHGLTALDIGCNAGFYSFELARRGARVTAIDHDPDYLAQARFACRLLGLEERVQFEQRSAYALADEKRRFDIVLFMGVFYHLRHPLLVLDSLAPITRKLLVLQTLTSGTDAIHGQAHEDFGFAARGRMGEEGWPAMAFIESAFADDPTNWWAPNRACVLALMRSAGFEPYAEPGGEIFLGKPNLALRSVFTETEWRAAARHGDTPHA